MSASPKLPKLDESLTQSHLCPSIGSISSNKDRINALYSSFRPRDLNPDSYDAKLKFWTKAIDEYVSFGNRFTFTIKELQKALRIDGGAGDRLMPTPACLPDVVEHLCRNGTLLATPDFYDFLKASTSWLNWSQVNVKRTFNKLVPLPNPWTYFSSPPEVRYVHVVHLKSLISSLHQDKSLNQIMNILKFRQLISSKINIKDPVELDLVLDYLNASKLILLDKVGHEDVVFFGSELNTRICITEVEKGRYDVKRSLEMHEERLEQLYEQIKNAEENCKKALKQGRRLAAKHELRKKKLIEKRVEKVINVVDSLTLIEMQIEEAQSDAKILDAYKSGKKALSETLRENNLTADSVAEAMLDVQDILDEQGEITSALAQPLDGQEDIKELDDELEMLLKQDEDEEKERLQREKVLRTKEEQDALKLLEGLTFGEDLDLDKTPGSLDSLEDAPSPAN